MDLSAPGLEGSAVDSLSGGGIELSPDGVAVVLIFVPGSLQSSACIIESSPALVGLILSNLVELFILGELSDGSVNLSKLGLLHGFLFLGLDGEGSSSGDDQEFHC